MPRVYRRKRVVAVSESTRSDLISHGFEGDQIDIVSNGVNVARPGNGVRRHRQPAVLYLGRLKPYKQVDVLIRAMPRVLERFPETVLDIVGQGPDRARLERLTWSLGLAGCVHFHGFLPDGVRNEVAERAWVAVCPSAFEGWGVGCVEASARGTPVIASRVAGLRDAVLDGVTGVLVAPADSDALAAELIGLFSDPARRRRMGKAGQAWAAKHTWERSAAALGTILGMAVAPGEERIASPGVDVETLGRVEAAVTLDAV